VDSNEKCGKGRAWTLKPPRKEKKEGREQKHTEGKSAEKRTEGENDEIERGEFNERGGG